MDPVTALLVAARDGDRRALEELVRATQADVWRFCAGLVGPGGADDATQETFVRAWRSAPAFRAESSARTWLLSIARRACADQRRRGSRSDGVAQDRRSGVTGDGQESVALEDLVARLDPDRRAAFVATQVVGLRYAEAAEVLGCPIGTVRSRVARARGELIDALADEAGPPLTAPGRQPSPRA